MQPVQPYLTFNGNCREAMDFYATVFGGRVDSTPYAAAPPDANNMPPNADVSADRVMHATLVGAPLVLMASDTPVGRPVMMGHNFSLSIVCDSRGEQEQVFAALAEGGTVTHPLADTFWGAHFGMVTDPFGVSWMLSTPA